MNELLSFLSSFASSIVAASTPSLQDVAYDPKPRQPSCANTATSRRCWGDYSIDTNYHEEAPTTNVTREYWLSVDQGDCAPDGYPTTCMTFNGTVPGPLITADWGDNLIIHVANNLETNGTAIHWHGVRQLHASHMDGVPGITQCPVAQGGSFTYSFRAMEYGTSWYHSHMGLQYVEGLLGPLILHGPSTADYDEDLGELFLSDWSHRSVFALWEVARKGVPPTMDGGLINGTNTYNCTGAGDDGCTGVVGAKHEAVFVVADRN
ncbi:Laccase-2 [Cytospora mali]|uniref:Laccase-2 n=1 Tax=Cytospora mali TaxID=578113 RepID=A0A194VHR9_CYTMA|nr:Laccase-2 [Valsa mali]